MINFGGDAEVLEESLVGGPELPPHGLAHAVLCLDQVCRLLEHGPCLHPLEPHPHLRFNILSRANNGNGAITVAFKQPTNPETEVDVPGTALKVKVQHCCQQGCTVSQGPENLYSLRDSTVIQEPALK